ncbi:MAG: hypothetical protein UU76_C0010G0005 [Parcubacteria group bacterium GW2011_GWC1_41_7]|nr:MAG: hypothetical protein UU76_C0010G0005 [Parcubacteria group bacterium GW2011_GWC1_41_7]
MITILFGEDFLIQEHIQEITHGKFTLLSFQSPDFLERLSSHANQRLWGTVSPLVVSDAKDIPVSHPVFSLNCQVLLLFAQEPKNLLTKLAKQKNKSVKIIDAQFDKKISGQQAGFQKWITQKLKEYRIVVHPGTATVLAQVFKGNPAFCLNEFKKLAAFRQDTLITQEELKSLVRWPNESNVFEVSNFLREKDFVKFYHYLKREMLLMKYPDKDVIGLLRLLQSTIFSMLLVKYAMQAKQLDQVDLKQFYKQLLLRSSTKFSYDELIQLHDALSGIERKYKKFAIRYAEIPEELLLGIS